MIRGRRRCRNICLPAGPGASGEKCFEHEPAYLEQTRAASKAQQDDFKTRVEQTGNRDTAKREAAALRQTKASKMKRISGSQ